MRYAIYFAPPAGSLLWNRACHWLGRDPLAMLRLKQPAVPGVDPQRLSQITARPRRYGFHATLKPPFRLSATETPEQLFASIAEFVQTRNAFALPRLEIARLGDFLALRPQHECARLSQLAEECVACFDRFRAPLPVSELAQRRHGLDARQESLLRRWGYPYVMDEWRFHMTLSGKVRDEQIGVLTGFLSGWFDSALREPLVIEDLCVFLEAQDGGAFQLVRRFPLAPPG
jgi:putative phosphonate metabolism protein